MTNEIPDGVPENIDVACPAHGVRPTPADYAAAAIERRCAREALVNIGMADPDENSIEWVAERAFQHAATRLPSPWVIGEPSPGQKFMDALLNDASDDEILALARQTRKLAKDQRDADSWKDGA